MATKQRFEQGDGRAFTVSSRDCDDRDLPCRQLHALRNRLQALKAQVNLSRIQAALVLQTAIKASGQRRHQRRAHGNGSRAPR